MGIVLITQDLIRLVRSIRNERGDGSMAYVSDVAAEGRLPDLERDCQLRVGGYGAHSGLLRIFDVVNTAEYGGRTEGRPQIYVCEAHAGLYRDSREVFERAGMFREVTVATGAGQRDLAVGMRVRVGATALGVAMVPGRDPQAGWVGRICVLREMTTDVGVDFSPMTARNGHDCDGTCPREAGFWFHRGEVTVVDDGVGVGVVAAGVVPVGIPRLRVRISLGDGYWHTTITNGPDVDELSGSEIRVQMPREHQRTVTMGYRGYDGGGFVHRCIERLHIPPQVMVDAVTKAVIAKQARESGGVFESTASDIVDADLARLLTITPPLMAIGDKLFTLTPQGVVNGARGMALIRNRVTAAAKETSKRLIEQAQAEGKMLLANAQRKLMEVTREVEAVKASGRMVLPEWVVANRIPVRATGRGDTKKWFVGITLSLKVDEFTLTSGDNSRVFHWVAKVLGEADRALQTVSQVIVWMPVDFTTGSYAYGGISDGCRSMEGVWVLPHINSGGCCMTLQGAPEALKDYRSFKDISDMMNRGMRVVNMSSLLGRDWKVWHLFVQAQVPMEVKRVLDAIAVGNRTTGLEAGFRDAAVVLTETEAGETFTPDTVEAAIRAGRAVEAREVAARQAVALREAQRVVVAAGEPVVAIEAEPVFVPDDREED